MSVFATSSNHRVWSRFNFQLRLAHLLYVCSTCGEEVACKLDGEFQPIKCNSCGALLFSETPFPAKELKYTDPNNMVLSELRRIPKITEPRVQLRFVLSDPDKPVKSTGQLSMNNFDWVSARVNCSASARFEMLCADIAKDVDTRNTLSPKTAYACQRTGDILQVIRTEDNRTEDEQSVTFSLEKHQIVVRGYRIQSPKDTEAQRVFITRLDRNGDCCLLEVGAINDGFESRGIRESTLDALFFDSHSDRPGFP